MELKLSSLHLRHFKSFSDYTFSPQGKSVSVFAGNGLGKTSLMDAWLYLLFSKDSQNRADFEILPLDQDGQRLKDVTEAEIEGEITVDDKRITLKRVYTEKWTKRRNATTRELTGHETRFFVNGVPTKERDYKQFISTIIDEPTFRLLSDSHYFNSYLKPDERRATLLRVCGDITDADVIACDKALAELPAILGQHTQDEYRKIVVSTRADINKRLAEIPTRIDEAERAMPTLPDNSIGLDDPLPPLRAARTKKLQVKAQLQQGGGVAEATKELREVEGFIQKMDNTFHQEVNSECIRLEKDIGQKKLNVKLTLAQIDDNNFKVKGYEERLADLAKKYREENGRQLAYPDTSICPTCRRPLDPEQVEAARAEAQAAFNKLKADRLENITLEGRRYKAAVAELKADSEKRTKQVAALEQEVVALEKQLTAAEANPGPTKPEYQELVKHKKDLEDLIASRQAGKVDTTSIDAEISALDKQISEAEGWLAQIRQREQGGKRIEALKGEQRRLAAEFEQLEKALDLLDTFVKRKVAMLTDRINGLFSIVTFKLFEPLLNGGVSDCCETLVNGVPWNGGLNNAGQIAAGLDIIETIAKHYQLTVPIWIDQAEAIVSIPPTTSQQIRLIVSGADTSLRVVKE
jgi:chromosome segregation ATPase